MTKPTKALLTSEGNKVWFTEEPEPYGATKITDREEWLSSYQLIPFADNEQFKVATHIYNSGTDFYSDREYDITQFVEVRSNCCGRCVDSDECDGKPRLFFKMPVEVGETWRDAHPLIVNDEGNILAFPEYLNKPPVYAYRGDILLGEVDAQKSRDCGRAVLKGEVEETHETLSLFGNYLLINSIRLKHSNHVEDVIQEFLKSDYYSRGIKRK